MKDSPPTSLGLIAGNGAYPILLAESAKQQGVQRVVAVAFKKETDPAIDDVADEVTWIRLGQLAPMLDALSRSGVKHAVMAGQITPTHLFSVRMDGKMLDLLRRLPVKTADTVFGAVADELKALGIGLLPAHTFMESHMPEAGQLSGRPPTDEEQRDIEIGLKVAGATSGLDIGQTVVIKQGTILAVESFEGTDETIRRAGKLGGAGIVVVKLAKETHDMRFDIPVIGMRTMRLLKKVKAGVLAIEAGRSIVLEREKVIAEADRMHLCFLAVASGHQDKG
jgi:DUF1009 family protein